jgi:hypothetical protein
MGFLEDRRRKKELQRMKEEKIQEDWNQAKQDLKDEFGRLVAGVPDHIQKVKEKREREHAAFYSREWTLESARAELKNVNYLIAEYEKDDTMQVSESFATLAEAFLSPFLAPVGKDGEVVTLAELHRRAHFLEERIRTLGASRQLSSGRGSRRDEQLADALADRRRDRRYQATESLGGVDELRELRRLKAEKLTEIEDDETLTDDEREEQIEMLEQDYERCKQSIKNRGKRDIFER